MRRLNRRGNLNPPLFLEAEIHHWLIDLYACVVYRRHSLIHCNQRIASHPILPKCVAFAVKNSNHNNIYTNYTKQHTVRVVFLSATQKNNNRGKKHRGRWKQRTWKECKKRKQENTNDEKQGEEKRTKLKYKQQPQTRNRRSDKYY